MPSVNEYLKQILDKTNTSRSVTPFINEHLIESPYTEAFNDRVYILGDVDVPGHEINVTIDNQPYSYESVGLFKIDDTNKWNANSKRMAFKDTQSASYIAFDETVGSWVYSELGDHSTNYRSNNPKYVLSSIGTLPRSYGDIDIDINYNSIESKYFSLCEPKVKHFTDENVMQVSFSGIPQVGFIILK
tara:strand:- start:228 stop:791 length:564 start_codon:yes stop_codon:yes gene_type:complete